MAINTTELNQQRLVEEIRTIDALDDSRETNLERWMFLLATVILMSAPGGLAYFLTNEVGSYFAHWQRFGVDQDTVTAYVVAGILEYGQLALVIIFAFALKSKNRIAATFVGISWLLFAGTSGLAQYLYLVKYAPPATGLEQTTDIARAVCCTILDPVAAIVLLVVKRHTLDKYLVSLRKKTQAIQELAEANDKLQMSLAESERKRREMQQEIDRREQEYRAVSGYRDMIISAGLATLSGVAALPVSAPATHQQEREQRSIFGI